ncbi:dolichol-phosphate mannosyltransferase [Ordospora colligata]|uniref:Dolichol-phosphate mannosyltransferase subunit 1 n=1 Tax=Ordospora colligata OC4 TaxID=1354746 RepID=A0A0B2ULT5_9MICR|nr:dolichol-phosphate mannosyltransferase [Ordospora colligata OC4]KHN69955.1 dolichol-phosphate mannosyltransferase [Ordospora colligata OC4]TBU16125.1 dolichol-phosphate mannosyltransferase [Ordospora colligata]TBU16338.1 dolichol-phosphate mannosyltransferase [Ordospora colligata]TBU19042.1 dolichol-phosphate mannosyltransferase [Ordospora colligata]
MYNVIIPTYNEKDNIGTLLLMVSDVMKEVGKPFKIVVVDDGSPDGTCDVVRRMKIDEVHLVEREKKLGLGSAYRAALEYCEYEFTVMMDGDMSHDPIYIKEMIKIQKNGADIVAGSRYNGGGVYGWPMSRKVVSVGSNNLARIFLGIGISDVTGSFRLYRTDVLKLLVQKSRCMGYSFQMELICLALRHGFKVSECPIVFHERCRGASKLSVKEILMYAKTVGVLFMSI